MTYEFLRLSVEERVAWIEYRRPPLNAIDWKMLGEIPAALNALLHDSGVRVIVFASALEKYFSTGADLRVFQTIGQEDMRRWVQTCHSIVRQMREARKPLLAAIHGTAVGGGLEIVLHCDVRFAAATARLGQPEINIAFIPPVGTTQSLPRLLGRPRALRFLYEGALVSAEEARGMGLVDFVVPPERLRGRSSGVWGLPPRPQAGGRSRSHPPASRQDSRCPSAMRSPWSSRRRSTLAGTPDFKEGLSAFREKRPPKWE